MKKTLATILIFAVVLAACLGVAKLIDWLRPAADSVSGEKHTVVTNVLDESAATWIRLSDEGVLISGIGAVASDDGVEIVYPGTYRVCGSLSDGQIVVDCEDFHGGVYILLDGADISCAAGPAIYVKQAEKTVLHLAAGSVNRLADGNDTALLEELPTSAGGTVYSCDDLTIEGEGSLEIVGNYGDGIRSKDGLTITSGVITVLAAENGLRGSDCVEIRGGEITVTSSGCGIAATKGDVVVSDGVITVTAQEDGLAAEGDVILSGGDLSVVTCDGAAFYETVKQNETSAKGIKGRNVTISGGTYRLDTADDAVRADDVLSVCGGEITIRSGDDAFHSAQTIVIEDGRIAVETGREGLEAAKVTMAGGVVSICAEKDGVDALGGFFMTGGTMTIEAPLCVTTEGIFSVEDGLLWLWSSDGDTALSFGEGNVTGGTVVAGGSGTAERFRSGGSLPASVLFVLPDTLAEGASFSLWNASGECLLEGNAAQPVNMLMVASGAMGVGQKYTLTAGTSALVAFLEEGNIVVS